MAIESADRLVAISRFARDGYLSLSPRCGSKIVDIPNGVDVASLSARVERPAGLDPAIQPGRYLLFIGRLHHRKGVDVLLEALTRAPRRENGVDLVIAGDGPERSALASQAARLGVADRVRFLGMTLGAVKAYLMQNSICLVAPSRGWESFGLIVVESFAAGRPVIVSELPGMGDLVEPGNTGFLVAQESPEELAEQLEHALSHREEMDVLGSRSQLKVRQYDWGRIAIQHRRLYAELCDDWAKPTEKDRRRRLPAPGPHRQTGVASTAAGAPTRKRQEPTVLDRFHS